MTKRQVERAVERYVALRFPELSAQGDLLIGRDGPLLRGFAIERSNVDVSAFRLRVFAQLLSVPTDVVSFGLSHELGTFTIVDGEEAAFTAAARVAEEEGTRFLALAQSSDRVIRDLSSMSAETSDDRLIREVRCHCLVLCGSDEVALGELLLRPLVRSASRGCRLETSWRQERRPPRLYKRSVSTANVANRSKRPSQAPTLP